MKRLIAPLSGFLMLLTSLTSIAAKPKPTDQSSVLWDRWYTVMIEKNGNAIPSSYYNEKVENRGDQIQLQVNLWKKEDDFLNEEHYGGLAENNAALRPKLYHFQGVKGNFETSVDANVQPDGNFLFKILQTQTPKKEYKRGIPKNVILASFFPVWVGKNIGGLKAGESKTFSAILEDQHEQNFAPMGGNIRLEKPDDLATKTQTQKISVTFGDAKSIWYVKSDGSAYRIEMKPLIVKLSDAKHAPLIFNEPSSEKSNHESESTAKPPKKSR